MASLNKCMLIGNLGKDPECRQIPSGQSVASFSIATKESYTKDNQRHEKTEWHKIVAWGKTAELVSKYLKKGSGVYIEGKLQTRKYTNKDGHEQYATEIVAQTVQFMDKKPKDETTHQEYPQPFEAHELDAFSEIPF